MSEETSQDARIPLVVFGRTLGTFTGWDGDLEWVVYYDVEFDPKLNNNLPNGDLSFTLETGILEIHTGNNELRHHGDLIQILSNIERDEAIS